MAKRTGFRPQGQLPFTTRARRFVRRWVLRLLLLLVVVGLVWITTYRWMNPPTTFYMQQEEARLGSISHEWVDLEGIAPVMLRAVVAAEDAEFCNHSGVDFNAIRLAVSDGAQRGGSTISQQTVKNAYLWQGRNWLRKGVEVVVTPVANLIWGKKRTLELYMNIIEFDTGVFGIQAAARHHFGVDASDLNRVQAGRLAAVLPNPRDFSAVRPSNYLKRRSSDIIAGSDMIRRDGRSACFED